MTGLWLSEASIKEIPESLGNLTNLTKLGLFGPYNGPLPKSIVNLKKLKNLWISEKQYEKEKEYLKKEIPLCDISVF